MGIITWVILGSLSGWIVSMIAGTNEQQGFLGNIIVGILGAVIGGFLANKLFDAEVTGLNLKSIAIAILGGLIFVLIWGALTGSKSV